MYINKDLHVIVACSSPSVSWDLSCSVNPVGELHCLVREVLGFLSLLIWPIFDLVFQFLLSKAVAFRFWCLVRFFNLVFGYQFLLQDYFSDIRSWDNIL